MSRTHLRSRVAALLAAANIGIDGQNPTDLRVRDERFFSRVIAHGSLGLGESYMEGWWETDDLDGFLFKLLEARLDDTIHSLHDAWLFLRSKILNLQHGQRAWTIGRRHYDLGNDLFKAMLGQRLVYSCGYWSHAND